jgi:hypothetical protein
VTPVPRVLLAMQKVEGSNPFSRFAEPPGFAELSSFPRFQDLRRPTWAFSAPIVHSLSKTPGRRSLEEDAAARSFRARSASSSAPGMARRPRLPA